MTYLNIDSILLGTPEKWPHDLLVVTWLADSAKSIFQFSFLMPKGKNSAKRFAEMKMKMHRVSSVVTFSQLPAYLQLKICGFISGDASHSVICIKITAFKNVTLHYYLLK